jgi:hypothetical protein
MASNKLVVFPDELFVPAITHQFPAVNFSKKVIFNGVIQQFERTFARLLVLLPYFSPGFTEISIA